jgi:hypothetical protein
MHQKGNDYTNTPNPNEMPPIRDRAGDRWSTFEDQLGQRREEVTTTCSVCGAKRKIA